MAAVQGLLKKHETFEVDLEVHQQRVDDILKMGEEVRTILTYLECL